MTKRIVSVLALCALWSGAASADTAGGNWPAITEAENATTADLQRMASEFPHSGLMQLRLAQDAIDADRMAHAEAALWRYIAMGGTLTEAGQAVFMAAFSDERWPLFVARMTYNAAPRTASVPAASVPANLGLVEGIVHVSTINANLVSSVTARTVYEPSAEGWAPFSGVGGEPDPRSPQMGSPMGMAFDAERGWLWVSSSAVDQTTEPDTAFVGMVGISPDRQEILWLPVGPGEQPGDVALGPDGSAYLSDGATGAVYVRRVGAVALERLVEPGRLRSAQGMVVSPDGSALIVADYSYGLARFDFETGALDRITYDGPHMLDGIDGLVPHGNAIFAIRNGVRPHAILRLSISDSGDRVTAVEIVERENPDWGEPTLGTISGSSFRYIADARWGDFGAGGALNEGAEARTTAIRAIDLSPFENQPDFRR
ncbi:hypothetical protein [Parasphingopyxis lamellibrachiae]|uniref:Uncharacterized protein n=1 Tax=Parasphingopyxis lamellibrachiae TaxID=680125 RepID=A0A3D9FCQ3_9SPHN|nr:hypothetical protein [Parasphingopyxis lamellibrachiae]RED15362.1 hypothetical protein DFR46_0353 [Parasphingopyxis lamellibrachiae]